jgi:tRNA nucleotidyltransferase/poly(A) polymerase
MRDLPADLARAARAVAETLRAAGHRAWLVGGAVRDLALEVQPKDVDLASVARPEELEKLFPSTHAVGRAFGTVVVHGAGLDVQVTTFRAESGYDDARRPSHVRFSDSLAEDAARRDFTCNALYLDPLTDELQDPTGGLADLAARRLSCVGHPAERFAEDGLRLLRLARLAAGYGLVIEPHTRAGAAGSLAALRGVSPERVFAELQRLAEGPAPARGAELLLELGVLARLPTFEGEPLASSLAARVAALGRLAGGGEARVFATLFRPATEADEAALLAAFAGLRPPRALQQQVAAILALARELAAVLVGLPEGEVRRARWIRLVRAPEFAAAHAVWRAWHPGELVDPEGELLARAHGLSEAERWPAALVTSDELARSGIPRGPRWGELLRAAEDAQLDGEFRDAEGARAWLAGQVR